MLIAFHNYLIAKMPTAMYLSSNKSRGKLGEIIEPFISYKRLIITDFQELIWN